MDNTPNRPAPSRHISHRPKPRLPYSRPIQQQPLSPSPPMRQSNGNRKPMSTIQDINIFDDDLLVEDDEYTVKKKAKQAKVLWNVVHATKVFLLTYSAVHNFTAALTAVPPGFAYALAQLVGITITEITVLAMYLLFVNAKFRGEAPIFLAVLTWGIGITFMGLGVLAHSQLQAGIALSEFLQWYLNHMSLAPLVMVMMSTIVIASDPVRIREMVFSVEIGDQKQEIAKQKLKLAKKQFDIKVQLADLMIDSLQAVADNAVEEWKSGDVQQFLGQMGESGLMGLLGKNKPVPTTSHKPPSRPPRFLDGSGDNSLPTTRPIPNRPPAPNNAKRPPRPNIEAMAGVPNKKPSTNGQPNAEGTGQNFQ